MSDITVPRKLLEDCARKLGYLVRDYPGDKEARGIIERIGALLTAPTDSTPAGVADVLAVHAYAQAMLDPPLTSAEVEALRWARACVDTSSDDIRDRAALAILDRLIATGDTK